MVKQFWNLVWVCRRILPVSGLVFDREMTTRDICIYTVFDWDIFAWIVPLIVAYDRECGGMCGFSGATCRIVENED